VADGGTRLLLNWSLWFAQNLEQRLPTPLMVTHSEASRPRPELEVVNGSDKSSESLLDHTTSAVLL
jgi:hypothetical protein